MFELICITWVNFAFVLVAIALFIPISVMLWGKASRFSASWKHRKYERYSETLLWVSIGAGVHMEPEDIHVQITARNEIHYIFDLYDGNDVVMIKTIEKKLKKMAIEKFPNRNIKILTNFKRNGRKIGDLS